MEYKGGYKGGYKSGCAGACAGGYKGADDDDVAWGVVTTRG